MKNIPNVCEIVGDWVKCSQWNYWKTSLFIYQFESTTRCFQWFIRRYLLRNKRDRAITDDIIEQCFKTSSLSNDLVVQVLYSECTQVLERSATTSTPWSENYRGDNVIAIFCLRANIYTTDCFLDAKLCFIGADSRRIVKKWNGPSECVCVLLRELYRNSPRLLVTKSLLDVMGMLERMEGWMDGWMDRRWMIVWMYG